MNKGKLWFYRDKYTSFLPYAFTQTERFQSQTLIYRCTALHHHHGCRQNLNAKACFNLWYGLKGEVLLSLEDRGNILLAVFILHFALSLHLDGVADWYALSLEIVADGASSKVILKLRTYDWTDAPQFKWFIHFVIIQSTLRCSK